MKVWDGARIELSTPGFVGTQKNGLNEYPKHVKTNVKYMLKIRVKKYFHNSR